MCVPMVVTVLPPFVHFGSDDSSVKNMMTFIKTHRYGWLAVLLSLLTVSLGVTFYLRAKQNQSAREAMTMGITSSQCDLKRAPCQINFADLQVQLILLTPPKYLVPFDAEVVLRGKLASDVAHVTLQLQMNDMQMHLLATNLIPGTTSELATTRWRNKMMLPMCSSGRQDWLVEVNVTIPEKNYKAVYPLTMTPLH